MKPIALFLPSLGGGGAERVMATLARAFDERGRRVDLLLGVAAGPHLKDVPPTVRVIDLGAHRALAAVAPLRRYMGRERPSAMLATLTHANVAAVWARALSSYRPRLVLREAVTLTAIDRAHPDLRDRVLPRMVRATYPSADAIVTVSEGVARSLSEVTRLPPGRITVIYNPTIGPDVAERCARPAEHPWFGPDGPPVILAVGRLTEQKDFATLLRAFALVRARRNGRLVILGEGETRPALTALATELGIAADVDLPGFVRDPYPYLARAALFVLSSAWEGLPNSLIEALAAGCPVVSTDCPSGPREILVGGRYGTLVPVGDSRALAEAVLAAFDAPVDRSSLRGRASDFSVDRVADRYLEVLEPAGAVLPAAVAG